MIQTDLAYDQSTFLPDTQADISVIKMSSLTKNFTYDPTEKITVRGVTKDSIHSWGTVYLHLIIDGFSVVHKFHLFDDDLNIPTDGILGKDFLRAYRCNIDYDNMTCTIRTQNRDFQLQIHSELENGDIFIPPRAEIYKLFQIKSESFPVVGCQKSGNWPTNFHTNNNSLQIANVDTCFECF